MVTYSQIQHPRPKGEQTFQDICLKLLRLEWNDPYATLHGRSGQKQQGVDISGSDRRGNFPVAGCQCKGSAKNDNRKLTEKEIEEEVSLAKGFEPALDLLIIAYAGERDAKLQKRARELNDENKRDGLFEVVLWSWDDIVDRAEPYDELRKDIYIQDGYLGEALVLDPKRPPVDPIDEPSASTAVPLAGQAFLSAETATSNAAVVDAVAEARIDGWRDQIRAGSGRAVVNALRNFIAGLDDTASPRVRFRAYANLGAALEQSGQKDEAVAAFEQAAAADPETGDSYAYRARALFTQGKKGEAFHAAESALSRDPNQRLAGTVLIEAAPPEMTAEQLEARLGGLIVFPDTGSTLAARYSDEGRHEDAIRVARSIDDSETIAPIGIAIAQAILRRLEQSLEVRMGLPLKDEDRKALEEARQHLEEAWAWVKERPDAKSYLFVGANLVAAYRFTGRHSEADELAIETYNLDPDAQHLAERAVVAFMHRGDVKKSLEIATQQAEKGRERAALLAADMAVLANDWEALNKWSRQAYDEATNDADRAHAAERIVMAVTRLATASDGLRVADELRKSFPPNIAFEARVSEIARRSGDSGAIATAKERLDAFDQLAINPLQRFELANAYADQGQWSVAADLLQGLYTLDRPSEPLRQRLLYLYRADERVKAREFFESLSGDSLRSEEVMRLGAAIYEKAGMLPHALRALETALAIDDTNLRSRLDWLLLLLRTDDEKRVRKWIATATTEVSGDPEDIMEFAQLLDRYGRRADALALGYKTLKLNWGKNERVHTLYMALFLLHNEPDDILDVAAVANDTVAFLNDDRGGKTDFLIDAKGEPGPNVLLPEQPFAKLLLGKKVGDEVLSEGIGQVQRWRVVEIKHKYLDLFHRALETHETVFPGSKALGRFTIDTDRDDAFEPLFEQVRERARTVDEVIRTYTDKSVPVDTVAKVLGINAIDASRGMRFESKVVLESCLGTEAERNQAKMLLAGADEYMVDALTLAIWQEIGMLAHLAEVPGISVCVVQATVDLLAERVDAAKLNATQEGGSLQARGDQVSLVEPTKAELQSYVDSCTELLDWTRANARIVPTEVLENEGQAEKVLSTASIATLGTAVAKKIPVVLDDRRLRLFAAAHGVEQFGWTQALLMVWLDEERISRATYAKLVAALHDAKIGFVSVSSDDLLACVVENDANTLAKLVDTLRLPTVEAASLVSVVTNFIVSLWKDSLLKGRRDRLASDMLEIALARPDGMLILRSVAVEVYNSIAKFDFPVNLIAKWWEDYILAFVTGHFIRDAFFRRDEPPKPPKPSRGKRRR